MTAQRNSSGQFFAALNYEASVTFEQRVAWPLTADKIVFLSRMAEARRVADAMSDEIKQECTPIPFAARASRGVKLSPSPGLVAWKPRLAQNVSLRLGGFGAPSLHGSLAM